MRQERAKQSLRQQSGLLGPKLTRPLTAPVAAAVLVQQIVRRASGSGDGPAVQSAARKRRVCPSARAWLARARAPVGSDLSVFGKGKRVLHIDSEIAHRVLNLAVAE